MAFELLVKFVSSDAPERERVKSLAMGWLESLGRFDVVEGVVDGVEIGLSDLETSTGLVADERFASAPLALFCESKNQCDDLARGLILEFGADVRCAITEITDESWMQCWSDSFSAFSTKYFFIAPLGDPAATPQGLIRLEIDDSYGAFGTGQHATTRAVIRTMEEYFPDWKPQALLDVGTGTGIYLMMAHYLSVKDLAGTEISDDLVKLARENCEAIDVSCDIRLLDVPAFNRKYDVVIANILAPVLHHLMPVMANHLESGGRLIVSGFVDKEEPPILQAAKGCGLTLENSLSELGWKSLVLRKES
jgi:ribosomal protein L11 methyltransferase